jgi:CRP/FNR family transcriptional regulator, cyclic AMP receptor protein
LPLARSPADLPLPRSNRFDLIGFLPAEVQEAFERASVPRRYGSGQTIYQKEDSGSEMFRVISGGVRLPYLLEDGRELFHTLYHPGDCFGVTSLLDGGPRPQFAEAHGDTEVQVVHRRAFDELRTKYRVFDQALILLLSGDIRGLINRVNSARLELLPSRIARCILRYARRERSGELVASLSQAELATMVDASRQSVNKIVRELQESGLIAIGYGTVRIKDRDGLLRRTESI